MLLGCCRGGGAARSKGDEALASEEGAAVSGRSGGPANADSKPSRFGKRGKNKSDSHLLESPPAGDSSYGEEEDPAAPRVPEGSTLTNIPSVHSTRGAGAQLPMTTGSQHSFGELGRPMSQQQQRRSGVPSFGGGAFTAPEPPPHSAGAAGDNRSSARFAPSTVRSSSNGAVNDLPPLPMSQLAPKTSPLKAYLNESSARPAADASGKLHTVGQAGESKSPLHHQSNASPVAKNTSAHSFSTPPPGGSGPANALRRIGRSASGNSGSGLLAAVNGPPAGASSVLSGTGLSSGGRFSSSSSSMKQASKSALSPALATFDFAAASRTCGDSLVARRALAAGLASTVKEWSAQTLEELLKSTVWSGGPGNVGGEGLREETAVAIVLGASRYAAVAASQSSAFGAAQGKSKAKNMRALNQHDPSAEANGPGLPLNLDDLDVGKQFPSAQAAMPPPPGVLQLKSSVSGLVSLRDVELLLHHLGPCRALEAVISNQVFSDPALHAILVQAASWADRRSASSTPHALSRSTALRMCIKALQNGAKPTAEMMKRFELLAMPPESAMGEPEDHGGSSSGSIEVRRCILDLVAELCTLGFTDVAALWTVFSDPQVISPQLTAVHLTPSWYETIHMAALSSSPRAIEKFALLPGVSQFIRLALESTSREPHGRLATSSVRPSSTNKRGIALLGLIVSKWPRESSGAWEDYLTLYTLLDDAQLHLIADPWNKLTTLFEAVALSAKQASSETSGSSSRNVKLANFSAETTVPWPMTIRWVTALLKKALSNESHTVTKWVIGRLLAYPFRVGEHPPWPEGFVSGFVVPALDSRDLFSPGMLRAAGLLIPGTHTVSKRSTRPAQLVEHTVDPIVDDSNLEFPLLTSLTQFLSFCMRSDPECVVHILQSAAKLSILSAATVTMEALVSALGPIQAENPNQHHPAALFDALHRIMCRGAETLYSSSRTEALCVCVAYLAIQWGGANGPLPDANDDAASSASSSSAANAASSSRVRAIRVLAAAPKTLLASNSVYSVAGSPYANLCASLGATLTAASVLSWVETTLDPRHLLHTKTVTPVASEGAAAEGSGLPPAPVPQVVGGGWILDQLALAVVALAMNDLPGAQASLEPVELVLGSPEAQEGALIFDDALVRFACRIIERSKGIAHEEFDESLLSETNAVSIHALLSSSGLQALTRTCEARVLHALARAHTTELLESAMIDSVGRAGYALRETAFSNAARFLRLSGFGSESVVRAAVSVIVDDELELANPVKPYVALACALSASHVASVLSPEQVASLVRKCVRNYEAWPNPLVNPELHKVLSKSTLVQLRDSSRWIILRKLLPSVVDRDEELANLTRDVVCDALRMLQSSGPTVADALECFALVGAETTEHVDAVLDAAFQVRSPAIAEAVAGVFFSPQRLAQPMTKVHRRVFARLCDTASKKEKSAMGLAKRVASDPLKRSVVRLFRASSPLRTNPDLAAAAIEALQAELVVLACRTDDFDDHGVDWGSSRVSPVKTNYFEVSPTWLEDHFVVVPPPAFVRFAVLSWFDTLLKDFPEHEELRASLSAFSRRFFQVACSSASNTQINTTAQTGMILARGCTRSEDIELASKAILQTLLATNNLMSTDARCCLESALSCLISLDDSNRVLEQILVPLTNVNGLHPSSAVSMLCALNGAWPHRVRNNNEGLTMSILAAVSPWIACPKSIVRTLALETLFAAGTSTASLDTATTNGIRKYLTHNKQAKKIMKRIQDEHVERAPISVEQLLRETQVGLFGDLTFVDANIDRVAVAIRSAYEDYLDDLSGAPDADVRPSLLDRSDALPVDHALTGRLAGATQAAGFVQRKIDPAGAFETNASHALGAARQPLVMIGSLLERVPNIAGMVRSCEVFRARTLVVHDVSVMETDEAKSISVKAETWVPLVECKRDKLAAYLNRLRREEGYVVIGLEQTLESVALQDFTWPEHGRIAILIGNEVKGIPPELLRLVDMCLEIPQLGIVRSLNAHVSSAVCMWAYTEAALAHHKGA